MKTELDRAPFLVVLIIAIAVFPVAGLLEAWAIRLMWEWFVTPQFGLEVPSYRIAWGLAMLVPLFTNQLVYEPRDKANKYAAVIHLFVRPVLIVAAGYCVRFWFL